MDILTVNIMAQKFTPTVAEDERENFQLRSDNAMPGGGECISAFHMRFGGEGMPAAFP